MKVTPVIFSSQTPSPDMRFVKNFTRPDFWAKNFTSQKCINCDYFYFYANYARNRVAFWKNLHRWQKFYTKAGRDGRNKS